MNKGWIKLHRSITEHEIFFDSNAFRVFTWLLTNVDKNTGKTTIGRYWTSEVLRLNPNTFKDIIKRLEKKYKVITTKPTNRMTEISLLNWAKYQHTESLTPDVTPLSTPSGHHLDTTSDTTYTRIKNRELRSEKGNVSISYLENLPVEDIEYFTLTWDLTRSQLIKKASQLKDYCLAHGKKYKDYKALLRNAVSRDFKIRPTVQPQVEYDYDKNGLARLKKLKASFVIKDMNSKQPMTDEQVNERRNFLLDQAKKLA